MAYVVLMIAGVVLASAGPVSVETCREVQAHNPQTLCIDVQSCEGEECR